MENGFSSQKVTSTFFVLFFILFGSPTTAHAQSVLKGCAAKYYEAARALDDKRAKCGLSEDGQSVFCRTAARVNIPVVIEGFSFSINVGAVFRVLSQWKLIPNEFRRAGRLIGEANAGKGKLLERSSKKIGKDIPGVSIDSVAKVIAEANISGALCADNHLLNVREIRDFVGDEIVRQ